MRLFFHLMAVAVLALIAIIPAANANDRTAVVEGFRSAKFGMDEAALRKTIAADFGLKDDKLRRDSHPSEKTTVLSIQVNDLLPETGTAIVSYILGYQSKKLTQVNVAWQGKDAALGSAAVTLRDHFLAQRFPAQASVHDAQLPDGSILAFRGVDEKGRMVMVIYQPAPKAEAGKETPAALLRLSYILSPENPDIFRLKAGAF